MRAKRATFSVLRVLRFCPPFSPFEKLFKPLKLCFYIKLWSKKAQWKRFTKFSKGQKRFSKVQKKILYENSNSTFLIILRLCEEILSLPQRSGAGFFLGRPRGRWSNVLLRDHRWGFNMIDLDLFSGSILTLGSIFTLPLDVASMISIF